MPIRRQRGVAMIVVLLIIAMIAIIATNITSRNQLSVRRTLNLAQYDQAYWYALSAEELAKKILKQDLEDATDGVIHRQQYWAQANVVLPVEGGEIAGEISDMRACFNLNGLTADMDKNPNGQPVLPLAAQQFQGLLVALGMDDFAAERLAYTLKDYVDADTKSGAFGAEDAEYESRNVPYRAANTLLNHRSELRAILGFNQDIYLKIAPYVCAIPGDEKQLLNVNTVEVEHAALLAGMLKNAISVSEAESIINQRPGDGYEKIEDFFSASSIASLALDAKVKSSFVVKSDYFYLKAGAKVDSAIFKLDSILKVGEKKQFEVLSRQYGGQQ